MTGFPSPASYKTLLISTQLSQTPLTSSTQPVCPSTAIWAHKNSSKTLQQPHTRIGRTKGKLNRIGGTSHSAHTLSELSIETNQHIQEQRYLCHGIKYAQQLLLFYPSPLSIKSSWKVYTNRFPKEFSPVPAPTRDGAQNARRGRTRDATSPLQTQWHTSSRHREWRCPDLWQYCLGLRSGPRCCIVRAP